MLADLYLANAHLMLLLQANLPSSCIYAFWPGGLLMLAGEAYQQQ